MLSPKSEEFLISVLSYVKFSFDHKAIKGELQDHLIDKIEEYIEQGYGEEKAEQMAISDMGEAQEIGLELNREHNPILGWLWRVSHIFVVIFIIGQNRYRGGIHCALQVDVILTTILCAC